MKHKKIVLLTVLMLLITGALLAESPCSDNMWKGYSVYSGAWPAGPHYRHIQMTYGYLNPFNVPTVFGSSEYWLYPSPFVMFADGIKLDPLGIPLETIGDNWAMGSTDARLYQQWACYPGITTGLYTFWYFLRVGPEPAPGEFLPPYVYFLRPEPYEGLGNYYLIFNDYMDCCEAGTTDGSIGFWGNWQNKYTTAEMNNLLAIGRQVAPYLFNGLTPSNLRTTLIGAKTNLEKARAQMTALWLNVFTGKIGLAFYVNVSSIRDWNTVLPSGTNGIFTVNDVLYKMNARLEAGGLTTNQLLAIKTIAEALDRQTIMVYGP